MKKVNKFLLVFMVSIFIISCSKDADDARDSVVKFEAKDINGTWKHIPSGAVLAISITTGNGVYKAGPAPSKAVGGNALTKVLYGKGGYWEAYSHTYYSAGWSTSYTIVGLAMADDKKTFKIGTAVYTRQ